MHEVKAQKPRQLIEIGPGLGALTDLLIELKLPLHLIELDPELAAFWRKKELGSCLVVQEEDALQVDWRDLTAIRPAVLVSNLPYQISSRLLVDRCLDAQPLDAMILMFQKEVADKILSKAPSAETGFLSVLAQTFWHVRSVIRAEPRDFLPTPKVASQVLFFQPMLPVPTSDPRGFLEFLKTSFAAPRKLLSSNLKAIYTARQVLEALKTLGLPEKIRAHEVPLSSWLALYEVLALEVSYSEKTW
jgi:16S rRNA (adenine1518-N6/adenine1519-N6)-dimethyltransferase